MSDNRNFIVFEGPDFCGKSTLREAVHQRLTSMGIDHVLTREPGGTPFGEELRELLLRHHDDVIQPETDIFLHMAIRRQHVANLIVPSLQAGKWVLCDRFVYSTWALNVKPFIETHEHLAALLMNNMPFVIGDSLPEPLTFIIKTPDEVRMQRAAARGKPDRYESKGPDFDAKVVDAYRELSQAPSTYVVDGMLPLEAQVDEVLRVVKEHNDRLAEMAAREAEKFALQSQQAEAAPDQVNAEAEAAPGDVGAEGPAIEMPPFNFEASLDMYIQENVVTPASQLFPSTKPEDLPAKVERYSEMARTIVTKIYNGNAQNPEVLNPAHWGQLNREIHSMFHFNDKLDVYLKEAA